jgi:hypothetical protein
MSVAQPFFVANLRMITLAPYNRSSSHDAVNGSLKIAQNGWDRQFQYRGIPACLGLWEGMVFINFALETRRRVAEFFESADSTDY